MKKRTYKSRSCTESIPTNEVHKPEIGRYVMIDGKDVFIPSNDFNKYEWINHKVLKSKFKDDK